MLVIGSCWWLPPVRIATQHTFKGLRRFLRCACCDQRVTVFEPGIDVAAVDLQCLLEPGQGVGVPVEGDQAFTEIAVRLPVLGVAVG